MGKQTTDATAIGPEQVTQYLRLNGYEDAVVVSLAPLGVNTQEDLKSYGYGRPLRAVFESHGKQRDLVFRTMSPDPFGHSRRASRAQALILAFDTFNDIPRHIRALDIGAFDDDGTMLPMGHGEIFLVTDFVEGELYACDLSKIRKTRVATESDVDRARCLSRYLAQLHAKKCDPTRYGPALRDTIGGGEGVFGLTDSYPPNFTVIPPSRLAAIEHRLVDWRWKLRAYDHRAARTHGDFHPFNLLFREDDDFSVLDCSRGAAGEPADDLTCLSINYLFFALTTFDELTGPFRQLWDAFWDLYLNETGDSEVLSVVAPFFAWRALVLASPTWYPHIEDSLRDRLLAFAERLLDGAPFDPHRVEEILA